MKKAYLKEKETPYALNRQETTTFPLVLQTFTTEPQKTCVKQSRVKRSIVINCCKLRGQQAGLASQVIKCIIQCMTTAHQEKFDKFQQSQSKIYLSNRHYCSPRCQCNEGFSFNWFILCFSRCHFPTNSVATFVFNLNQIQAVIPLFALIKDSKRQLQELFRWPVYSVDENKLCCNSPRNKDYQ